MTGQELLHRRAVGRPAEVEAPLPIQRRPRLRQVQSFRKKRKVHLPTQVVHPTLPGKAAFTQAIYRHECRRRGRFRFVQDVKINNESLTIVS